MPPRKKLSRRTANPQFESRLSLLPLELRQEIYRHLFEDTVVVLPRRSSANRKGLSRSPPFLFTCRGFYLEAVDFYYKHSIFQIQHTRQNSQLPCLPKWLKQIGKKRAAVIKEIRVAPPIGEEKEWVEVITGKSGTPKAARDCCELAEWTIERAKYWVEKASGVQPLAEGVLKSRLKGRRIVSKSVGEGSDEPPSEVEVWTAKPKEYLKKWEEDNAKIC
ncbi:hypothetical protein CERZMDRAFT_84678 [Cercospora zeae-maydis SCOH1-5]|uniref:F-box domain-containing protein n=1 Tax=Cercospora zeae-maydis SCOH1-5 TaxID=717836 RepID=A0A6A6FGE1_9PEZI|nr:hypothetical protein CERZMDRAFT_84678 [Cercospora zeae-maydis SCOH1-5]